MPASLLLPDQAVVLIFLGLVAWAGCSDALHLRIPNAVCLGLALLFPAHVLTSPAVVDWPAALLVAGILFAAGLGLFALRLAGGGDVKFLAAGALWAGSNLVLPFLMVTGLAGGLLAVVVWVALYVRRFRTVGLAALSPVSAAELAQERVPYGIAIAAGATYVGFRLLNS